MTSRGFLPGASWERMELNRSAAMVEGCEDVGRCCGEIEDEERRSTKSDPGGRTIVFECGDAQLEADPHGS